LKRNLFFLILFFSSLLTPREMGGYAGGSKYFVDSIFFKFPSDEHHLYGGVEGLMKACGHEVKGTPPSFPRFVLLCCCVVVVF
jgi:hypothetical protein